VANDARLVLRRLIVEGRNARGGKVWRRRMALHAQCVHVGPVEQARIRPAVRRVAGSAAFRLHNVMLINERTSRFGVALDANGVLLCGGLESLFLESAVRVVAIGALHQPLIHFVMEGHGELRLDVGVALIAESRLGNREQLLLVHTGVNAVASDAAYVTLAVRRALKVRVLAIMATQA